MPGLLTSCLCPLHPLWTRLDIQPAICQASRTYQGPLISCLLFTVAGLGLSENSGRGLMALLASSSQPQLILWVLILAPSDKFLLLPA